MCPENIIAKSLSDIFTGSMPDKTSNHFLESAAEYGGNYRLQFSSLLLATMEIYAK